MKKIFTMFLVLTAVVGFAQRGTEFSSPPELTGKVVSYVENTDKDTQVLLPGNWASVNQVGTYRWGTAEAPLGWIFGNNSYGGIGAGAKFSVTGTIEVVGAYFWLSSAATADYDVVFGVYEFAAGAVGNLVASVTVARADLVVYATGTGITPSMYTNAFYVTFDTPVEVTGDFFLGFNAGDATYTTHGDGVALASAIIGQGGGGAGIAYILHTTDGWEPATDWNAGLDIDIGIFAVVQDPGGSGDGFTVTFNVDMNDVDGFDPATDEVWVTGNFAGWSEPGLGNSVQMSLASAAKDTPPYTLSESFEGFDNWVTSISPWTTVQVTTGPTYSSENFDFPGEGGEWAWKVFNPSLTTPPINANFPAQDGSKYLVAIQYTSTNDNKWLISPEVSINATSQLSFWARTYTAQYGLERIQVLVSTTNAEPGSFTKISAGDYLEVPITWTEYTYDLSAYAGQTIYFAIRYMSFDAFIFMLDNIKLTAEGAPQDLTYTATVQNVPAGELLYKYFSDAFGAGWAGGEWAGDPNRSVMIEGNTVLNNVWGDLVVGVDEIELDMVTRVFPNPVRNTLFIQSGQQIDYLRMFDMAGRVVYQAEVMDNQTTIDANLLGGGLYILQMVSGQQVKTHKIQVVK